MHKIVSLFTVCLATLSAFTICNVANYKLDILRKRSFTYLSNAKQSCPSIILTNDNTIIEETTSTTSDLIIAEEETSYIIETFTNEPKINKKEEASLISEEDISLIALVTMAEAEGESEQGKRLVIDTILNRVDSKHFPNNIHDVIWQKNQFTSMWNGRVNKCYVREDICKLILEEVHNRTNTDVVFFTAKKYSKYGKPLFREGNHYFSSYN